MTILNTKSVYYKDINLIAKPQFAISSRTEVPRDMSSIIVSPMSAVVGEKFTLEALDLGLTVCLHRFGSVREQIGLLKKIYDKFGIDDVQEGFKGVYVSVGLNDIDRVTQLKKIGHKQILLDVANGYLSTVVRYTKELSKEFEIMVGNVHSGKGINLYDSGKIRVGIASGSACGTSEASGYNRGQITEIQECYSERNSTHQYIVADGGIANAGCAAKAFGAGADYVMMGGYFSKAEEAQNIIDGEYKFWGGASHLQQLKEYGKIRRHTEGKEIEINKEEIKPLKYLVGELWGGISSAISYSGYANLTQFKGNAVFELKV
jgi:GMP reductase